MRRGALLVSRQLYGELFVLPQAMAWISFRRFRGGWRARTMHEGRVFKDEVYGKSGREVISDEINGRG